MIIWGTFGQGVNDKMGGVPLVRVSMIRWGTYDLDDNDKMGYLRCQ